VRLGDRVKPGDVALDVGDDRRPILLSARRAPFADALSWVDCLIVLGLLAAIEVTAR
jgi:hypothetical protein